MPTHDGNSVGKQFIFGEFALYANGVLLHKQQRINIPPKEFRVLTTLLASAGKLITKDHLLATVWPNEDASEESLTRCIYALRRLFLETKENRYIDTIYGKGYRFCRPVAAITVNASPKLEKCKIAILPFAMDSSLDHVSLHDSLIQCLSRYASFGLFTLPAALTRHCKSTADLVAIIEHFSPDYYLAGQLITSRARRILRIELIRTKDHSLLHRENIEWNGEHDVTKLQYRLITFLPQHAPNLCWNSHESTMLGSFDIAIAYLQGKHELLAYTPASLKRALSIFRTSTLRHPEHVMSWCALAETYLALATLDLFPSELALREAHLAINKALLYEPDHPLALALLAVSSVQTEPLLTDALLRQVSLLSPETPAVHYYRAWHFLTTNRYSEALDAINLCLQYDPSYLAAGVLKILIKFFSGFLDDAIMIAKQQLQQYAEGHAVVQSILAILLNEAGQTQAAQDLTEIAWHEGKNGGIIAINHCYIIAQHNEKKARKMLHTLLDKNNGHLARATLLPLVLLLDGIDAAKQLYQNLLDKNDGNLAFMLCDPRLKILRIVIGKQIPVCQRISA